MRWREKEHTGWMGQIFVVIWSKMKSLVSLTFSKRSTSAIVPLHSVQSALSSTPSKNK